MILVYVLVYALAALFAWTICTSLWPWHIPGPVQLLSIAALSYGATWAPHRLDLTFAVGGVLTFLYPLLRKLGYIPLAERAEPPVLPKLPKRRPHTLRSSMPRL